MCEIEQVIEYQFALKCGRNGMGWNKCTIYNEPSPW